MAVIINGDTGIDKITDGSVVNADLATGIDAAKLTGTLPAIDGSALTGISSYADSDALTLFNASGSAPVYAARAWVNFNGTGTVAIRASGNVSSITDNAQGDYTVNFTTAMSDTSYGFAMNAQETISGNGSDSPSVGLSDGSPLTTSSLRFNVVNATGNAYLDSANVSVTVFR